MIPKVIFKYSWIYDRKYFEQVKNVKLAPKKYPSPEKICRYIRKIEKLWKKDGYRILKTIQSVTGLKWKEKLITAYVVGITYPFSDPLTLPVYKDKNWFIDNLIHELIHRIQSQEDKTSDKAWSKWIKSISDKYKKEAIITKNHIFLHAAHKEIYLRLFNKNRLQRDINIMRNNNAYRRSWEIVEKEGHKNIIKQFREGIKK